MTKQITGSKMIILDKCSDKELDDIEKIIADGLTPQLKLALYVFYGHVECFDTRLKFIPNQDLNNCKIFLN